MPSVQKIAFYADGKPMGWFRRLLLNKKGNTRRLFKRFIGHENGAPKDAFKPWLAQDLEVRNAPPDDAASQTATPAAVGEARPVGVKGAESLANTPLKPSGSPETDAAEAAFRPPPQLEELVRQWIGEPKNEVLFSSVELIGMYAKTRIGRRPLYLTFSHDSYLDNLGGLQLCIQIEANLARARGFDYLHAHAAQPLPRLAHLAETPDPVVRLNFNSERIGAVRTSSLEELVANLAAEGTEVRTVIHQCLGLNPEQLAKIVRASSLKECVFWVHDYFSLCVEWTLLRNGAHYCNAPSPMSNACTICVSGPERLDHLKRMNGLFSDVPVRLVSPSQVALDLWRDHCDHPIRDAIVKPHIELAWETKADDGASVDDFDGPVRVGFLGYLAGHKGWKTFAALSEKFRGEQFEFVVLGSQRPSDDGLEWRKVVVTAEDEFAMVRSVREAKIDLVVLWSIWPETFSITAFEALEGGAFLLTNRISGNVQATVSSTGRGQSFDDEKELAAFFASDRAAHLARQARKVRRTTRVSRKRSDMSLGLFGDAAR